MTHLNPAAIDAVPTTTSYVDWPAIIAGAVVAAAISTLMTTFGAAIGLTAASPYAGEGLSANALGIAAALYVIWVVVSSFLVGGYLAGRLRRHAGDGNAHESEVRDGSHGLIVWGLGALLIAWLATATVGGAARIGADAASSLASAAGSSVKTLTQTADPSAYVIDRLVRGTGQNAPNEAVRTEITRIFANGVVTGSVNEADRAYLANEVARIAGVSPDEAQRRINDAVAQVNTLSEKAKAAADRARKTGIIVAFLTAASLVIAAAASWWAATMGGKHRDEGLAFSPMTRWH